MQASVFKVEKMDCPSEEQLIRLKLSGRKGVRKLHFDIHARTVLIYHDYEIDSISAALNQLQLNSTLISSTAIADLPVDQNENNQRKTLWIVLGINFLLFLIEITTGLVSNSMGLVADSLDMLADAIVYGLSLLAIGSTLLFKKKISQFSGYFQIMLAAIGIVEVVRRFSGHEIIPQSSMMILVSALALIGNATCLWILKRIQNGEAHLKASWIFTSNDVIINIGVILAGFLVAYFKSAIPDLVIGTVVFSIVINGAYRILQLSKP